MGNESSSRKRFSKKGSNRDSNKSSTASTTLAPPPNSNTLPKSGADAPKSTTPSGTFPAATGNGAGQTTPTKSALPETKAAPGDATEGGEDGADKTEGPSVVQQQLAETERKKKVSLDDFVLLKTVGKGSFGKVIQVRKKDSGKIYAMKVLKKDQVIKRKQYEHTMAERRILEEIDHPFIVSLRFAFQTPSKLYMVFDFFNGGELFHYLSQGGRFTEERARLYAAEITLALEHTHNNNIIYRDLKPENLLLDADGHIRVTDFGLSKENVVDDQVKSFCGTPEYLAPEVLKRQRYGKAVDWWSLGTLLYEMISGLPPFYDRNRERMYKKILGSELRFPAHMSAEAKSICRGMLTREPQQRLGYRGAQEIKAHPFFAPLNWDDVLQKKVEPPFKPTVTDEEDTRNVDKSFIAMPAQISPTPADSSLAAAAAEKQFLDFTYVAKGVMGDQGYQVSFDTEDEFKEYMKGKEYAPIAEE